MEVAIAVLIGVIIYQGVIHQLDKREAVRREGDLLNRVMARDYGQYAQAKITEKYYDKEPVTQEEMGVPM